jgi:hypothetical protein
MPNGKKLQPFALHLPYWANGTAERKEAVCFPILKHTQGAILSDKSSGSIRNIITKSAGAAIEFWSGKLDMKT